MRWIKPSLAVMLALLLLGLSFNAYACLLPLNGASASAMANGCPSQEEQSARQICDSFTTLSVQAPTQTDPASNYQTVCHEDTTSLFLLLSLSAGSSRAYDCPTGALPQDLLIKTSLLRL
ncbi:MAG: hypothetical protein ACREI9_02900 [Nitrospiraceae bacterium]